MSRQAITAAIKPLSFSGCKVVEVKLRKFAADDGEQILSWIENERAFRMWSADRFGDYPITPYVLASHYSKCEKTGGFFPMSAVDGEGKLLGHLILRYTEPSHTEVRFGFIIVDSSIRGQGIGRKMLELAKLYAADVLRAKRITLGVFENNLPAYHCYKAAGFLESAGKPDFFQFHNESWKCIEMDLQIP